MVADDLHAGGNEHSHIKWGLITAIAKRFNIAYSTVYRLWDATGIVLSPTLNSWGGGGVCVFDSKRLPINLTEFVQEGVKKVPLRKRHTQQKVEMLMGVSKTMVHHWIVASTIHVHCNSLKHILTEENKWARLEMALHLRDHKDLTKYQDMCDQIHLDEKCFFSCRRRRGISFFLRRKTQNIV